mmetsp:Transcript_11195/g.18935  ORF Transcript_11195/g.18935 Transcript_11195/m.18935 type:complete len:273 (-) Transcript_11195:255-1073(-)
MSEATTAPEPEIVNIGKPKELQDASLGMYAKMADNLIAELVELADVPEERSGWWLSKERGDIRIYARKAEGSPFYFVRGDIKVKYPAAKFANLFRLPFVELMELTDPMWITGEQVETLVNTPTELHAIRYGQFKFPWPCWNRDFVWYAVVRTLEDGTAITIARSIEHPSKPPTKNAVRAYILTTGYVAKPDPDDPNVTHVSYIVQADPRGWLPSFVVNYASISQAENVGRIRDKLEDPYYQELIEKHSTEEIKGRGALSSPIPTPTTIVSVN